MLQRIEELSADNQYCMTHFCCEFSTSFSFCFSCTMSQKVFCSQVVIKLGKVLLCICMQFVHSLSSLTLDMFYDKIHTLCNYNIVQILERRAQLQKNIWMHTDKNFRKPFINAAYT